MLFKFPPQYIVSPYTVWFTFNKLFGQHEIFSLQPNFNITRLDIFSMYLFMFISNMCNVFISNMCLHLVIWSHLSIVIYRYIYIHLVTLIIFICLHLGILSPFILYLPMLYFGKLSPLIYMLYLDILSPLNLYVISWNIISL